MIKYNVHLFSGIISPIFDKDNAGLSSNSFVVNILQSFSYFI